MAAKQVRANPDFPGSERLAAIGESSNDQQPKQWKFEGVTADPNIVEGRIEDVFAASVGLCQQECG